jgi:hypothetical protein
MILGFAVRTVSVQPALDEPGWKRGTWEGYWVAVWVTDQVRYMPPLLSLGC